MWIWVRDKGRRMVSLLTDSRDRICARRFTYSDTWAVPWNVVFEVLELGWAPGTQLPSTSYWLLGSRKGQPEISLTFHRGQLESTMHLCTILCVRKPSPCLSSPTERSFNLTYVRLLSASGKYDQHDEEQVASWTRACRSAITRVDSRGYIR